MNVYHSTHCSPDRTFICFISSSHHCFNYCLGALCYLGGWGQHGAHLGPPVGPRWAPCWLHEPCYQGCFITISHVALGARIIIPVPYLQMSCSDLTRMRGYPDSILSNDRQTTYHIPIHYSWKFCSVRSRKGGELLELYRWSLGMDK